MVNTIKVEKYNEVFLKIYTSESIHLEIWSNFTYEIPNWQLLKRMNKKLRFMDGKKRLYNRKLHKLPIGLLYDLYKFCKDRNYKLLITEEIKNDKNIIHEQEYSTFINDLKLPFKLRDYQWNAIKKGIERKKINIISPTASGKTIICFAIVKYFLQNEKGRCLIIEPTKGLIKQVHSDFIKYGADKNNIYTIEGGKEKQPPENTRICISTWQSIFELPEKYFDNYNLIYLDESHGLGHDALKLKSIEKILRKCTKCSYRYGQTGTLRENILDEKIIEGYIGKIYKSISTKELMDYNFISKAKINIIKLIYSNMICNKIRNIDWNEQLKFIEDKRNPRNEFIINLIMNLKNNTLVLFRTIEHGNYLYEELTKRCTNKEILYIDGSISADDREKYRYIMDEYNNIIIIGSFGTMSTGISINRVHNLVFASSTKSRIRVLQTIGRGLRLHKTKDYVNIMDITDELGFFKEHSKERIRYYKQEQFDYNIKSIEIEKIKEKYLT